MTKIPSVDIFSRVPARLGEGPLWHPQRQSLWWVDITGQKFFEAKLTGEAPRTLDCAQMIGAVVATARGGLLAALHDGIHLVDPETGRTTPFASAPLHDAKEFRFNDGKVDPRGRFWAGTMALDFRRGQSRLYRFAGDRSATVMQERVSISNGLAWSPDAKTLYYIDSPMGVVQSFAFDLEEGAIGPSRVAITIEEGNGLPDGCCMDAEGCLWIGHWGGSKVTRWEPRTGRLLATVPVPVRNVTSCAFGGPRLDRLFITTAMDEENKSPEPEAGLVFCVEPGVTGQPVASFIEV
ncbi:SMP-30/gluconolactonase/LRE family protein [Prosthecobacter sp.]